MYIYIYTHTITCKLLADRRFSLPQKAKGGPKTLKP